MFLTSNYQPVKTDHKNFSKVFNEILDETSSLEIVTGYVSEKSIKHLSDHILKKGRPTLNLIIGMHYFDKFTHSQYNAAIELEKFLENYSLGSVHLITSFPFHGKLYSFKWDGNSVCIIGSSNLDNIILKNPKIQYETDFLINDELQVKNINSFIYDIRENSSQKLSSLNIKEFRNTNNLLEGLSAVKKLEKHEVNDFKTKVITSDGFSLPLKPYEVAGRSNLHTHLGKGRENKSTGITLPRSWYEVELIIPFKILENPRYPNNKELFQVVTDDGYKFECKTSGTNGKNLRSVEDLKKLGKWIKGRMLEAGVVRAGENITQETLDNYGRDTIGFYPTEEKNTWFMDFSTRNTKE